MSQFETGKLLDRTEMSHNLRGSLQRAITYAFEQSHRQVTLEHLLLAFADDREAAVILESSSVNVSELMTDVSGYLGRLADRVPGGQPQQPELGGDVQHIIQSAGAAAQKSKRRAVTSALVLAAVVGDGRSPSAQMLRNHGLTFENAIAALKQATSNAAARPTPEPVSPPSEAADLPAQPLQTSAAPAAPAKEPAAPVARTPAPGSALAASTAAATNAGAARLQNMQAAHEIIASARERIAAARGTIATRPDEPDLAAPAGSAQQSAAAAAPSPPPPSPPGPPSGPPTGPPVYLDPPQPETVAKPPPATPEMLQASPAKSTRAPSADLSKRAVQASVVPAPSNTSPPPISALPLASPQSAPPDWAAQFSTVAGDAAAGEQPMPSEQPRSTAQEPARAGNQSAADKPTLAAPPKLAPPPTFDSEPSPPRLSPPVARPPAPLPPAAPVPDQTSDRLQPTPPAAGPRPSAPPHVEGLSSLPYETPPPPAPDSPARQQQPSQQHPVYDQQPAQRPYESTGGLPANVPQYAQPAPPPPTAYVPARPSPPAMHPGQPPPDVSPIEPELLAQDIPTRMRVGVPQTIEIRAPRARLEAWSGGNADPRARDEQIITKAMVMRLRAPEGGFTIETASPETQWSEGYMGPLSDDVVSWRWIVTPTERGSLPMQLIVSSRIVGRDGLAAARALPEQLVAIRVAPNYGRMASRVAIGASLIIAGLVLGYFGEGLFGIGSSLLAQR